MSETKMCSKCSQNEATEKHSWCRQCKATYQREYALTLIEKKDREGFYKGVAAMREYLRADLARRPHGLMQAWDVAEWISACPGPKLD